MRLWSLSEWCYNELKGDSLSALGDLLVLVEHLDAVM